MTEAKRDEMFESFFRQGTRLLHQGRAQEATPLLERASQMEPEHVDAALNLSGAYILTGKFKWAIPLLEALADKEPENAMIWTNLGAAYLGNPILAQDEEQQRAIAAFERALEINPAAPNVAYNIGLIHRDRKETAEAIRWFERAIQANPHDRDARSILSRLMNMDEET
ncbi:MAG: tetratricopeptide repeat protein [Chloroflexi bacterium]|nr:tetratricopeptide repeat protein [Chloroflexota bacterium]MCI0577062.1 tetratricopeptide repeat protein [Chloroflexota bacterium]MCI0643532.1 tetratricopeptide repeat protein [Chloroflexota bacterium]MCI0728142.1 tetratricopeptide repeat protein [Chloroflexota bacterium]